MTPTPTPPDYAERVYAGILGKLIGVYLGRPFEGWSHERIEAELGEIHDYVTGHPAIAPDKRDNPLVQTDDDISGTFTFLRALPDNGNRRDIRPAEIGEAWLNYLVENRSTLWWGGVGLSTEHTCFLRLKDGTPAPASGSARLNGAVLSEQIGAQIFIDGWAMVAPGDPELAAELARRAASVSHDGEAVMAAQVVAAMEAQAFVESDIDALLDTGVSVIPRDSLTARLIDDVRAWHAGEADWRATRALIASRYGYDSFGGNCHVVPNHALIIHGLLHGGGDFGRSLSIVNTCGWDTDCNSGNLGCLLGIRNGLAGIEARWREPVGDRLYLSSADGGRSITDAVIETRHVVGIGRALAGESPLGRAPRFAFELPGSTQGFRVADGDARLENVQRSLAVRIDGSARILTPTFTPPDARRFTGDGLIATPWLHPGGYALLASPTLYPGQTLVASVKADRANPASVDCRLVVRHYDGNDELTGTAGGPESVLRPGEQATLSWRVPDTGSQPIAEVGLELRPDGAAPGVLYLDFLTWHGAPDTELGRPATGGTMWRRAWVPGVERFEPAAQRPFQLVHNRGRGLLLTGTGDWEDYEVTSTITPQTITAAAGIAARTQGLRRYYALLLEPRRVRLVKVLGGERTLAEAAFAREPDTAHELGLRVVGQRLEGQVDGEVVARFEDLDRPLLSGGVAFVCEEGCVISDAMSIRSLEVVAS